MKVIFLDIDGVLNIIPESVDEFGAVFHSNFVNNLKWIIEETDAKLVISSTWRYGGLNWLKRMWKYRNYPGEIIGITPSDKQVVKSGLKNRCDLVGKVLKCKKCGWIPK